MKTVIKLVVYLYTLFCCKSIRFVHDLELYGGDWNILLKYLEGSLIWKILLKKINHVDRDSGRLHIGI